MRNIKKCFFSIVFIRVVMIVVFYKEILQGNNYRSLRRNNGLQFARNIKHLIRRSYEVQNVTTHQPITDRNIQYNESKDHQNHGQGNLPNPGMNDLQSRQTMGSSFHNPTNSAIQNTSKTNITNNITNRSSDVLVNRNVCIFGKRGKLSV